LVKGEKSPKVDVVFCNFQPPKQQSSFRFGLLGTKTSETGKTKHLPFCKSVLNVSIFILYVIVIENKIGYVDVKSSSGVYFSAISKKNQIADSGILLFDKTFLNIGNGMDTSTGVLTAPKAGIYHFSFSVLKEGYALVALLAHLRLNENKLGVVHVGDGLFASQASMHSTLKLKKDDRIDVWIATGKLHYIHKRSNHFTGWLLEEHLEN